MSKLKQAKLVEQGRDESYVLTKKGETEAEEDAGEHGEGRAAR